MTEKTPQYRGGARGLVALLTVAAMSISPAAAADLSGSEISAKPAKLVGRVDADKGRWAKRLPGSVLALQLVPGGAQYSAIPGKNRKYRMTVEPGVYGVAATRWKGKRAVTTASLVRVRPGKTARVQAARVAAEGPLVSVGKVTGPGGVDLSSAVQAEMVSAADASPCDFNIVVDRKDPAYKEILKELNLNTTKYFPEKTRKAAREALKNQAALAPQYRVEATITQAGGEYDGAASGTFRLVQAATGTVLFEKQVSFENAGTRALFELAAKDLAKAVCGVPIGFAGTVQADITATPSGQKWRWNGTAGFELVDGGERPDGSFVVEYKMSLATVSSSVYTVPPRSGCSETRGEWSGTPPLKTGFLTLTIAANGSRSYRFSVGVNTGPTTVRVTCQRKTISFVLPAMGLGATSGTREAWLGPTLAGSYSGPWVPVDNAPGVPLQMKSSWVLQPVGLEVD